jgi:hypothetical protein
LAGESRLMHPAAYGMPIPACLYRWRLWAYIPWPFGVRLPAGSGDDAMQHKTPFPCRISAAIWMNFKAFHHILRRSCVSLSW